MSDPADGKSCEGCYPQLSTTSWTKHVSGYPCANDGLLTTNDVCDGQGICVHEKAEHCTIATVSYWAETATRPTSVRSACRRSPARTGARSAMGCPAAPINWPRRWIFATAKAFAFTPPAVCVRSVGRSMPAGRTIPRSLALFCNPKASATNWDARGLGTSCADDGNACTLDTCDGYGACQHTPKGDAACATDGDIDAEPATG